MKIVATLLTLLMCAGPVLAQEGTIKLRVKAQDLPRPALRYQLLPELRELSPGNAALLYYRAFTPEWGWQNKPEAVKALDQWNTRRPLPENLRWVRDSQALKEVDLAARREFCDWELTPRFRKDGLGLLLGDAHTFRTYGALLAARARLEFEAGQHVRAGRTFQTGFRLARDVANAPTLIQALIGLSVAHTMLTQLEEWLQQPGAPNLYWALSSAPRPFIDLRKPLQGERIFLDNLLPGVRDALYSEGPMKAIPGEELKKSLEFLVPRGTEEGKILKDWKDRLLAGLQLKRQLPLARKALMELGHSEKDLDKVPMLQTILCHEVLIYDSILDESLKWLGQPYWIAGPAIERRSRELDAEVKKEQSTTGMLARLLLPAVGKVTLASARTDRRLAALQTIEAIRLHAARNAGKLPNRLVDIKAVPVPVDPMTGQLFDYTVKDSTFTLKGAPIQGQVSSQIDYEVTLVQ